MRQSNVEERILVAVATTRRHRHVPRRRGRAVAFSAAIACVLSLASPGASSATAESLESGLWYFERGNVQAAHDAGYDGEGVTIAVIDTQVNLDAPGLRGADVEVRDDSYCFDASGNRHAAESRDYIAANHGTNVVSMIVGTGEDVGGSPIKGVAPGAKVLYYDAMITSEAPSGNSVASTCLQENGELIGAGETKKDRMFSSGLAQPISDAVDDGADIISVSLGGLVDASYAVAKAHAAGVVVLGALPNVGGVGDWPSSCNGVVAVQAFGPDGKIQYSTYDAQLAEPGPNLSDDVIIASPGLGIAVQGSPESWDAQQTRSGTSLATPVAAGFLAVVKQKYPAATGDELIQSLIHNTGTTGEHEPEWNNSTGYGAVSLTGMLAVDPSKYPDVNPLFDGQDDAAVPSQLMVDDAARALDTAPSSEPPSAGDAEIEESTAPNPLWVGGGIVLGLIVLGGGGLLALFLVRSSRRRGGHHELDKVQVWQSKQ